MLGRGGIRGKKNRASGGSRVCNKNPDVGFTLGQGGGVVLSLNDAAGEVHHFFSQLHVL